MSNDDKGKKAIVKKETFGAVAQIKKPEKNTDQNEKNEKESDKIIKIKKPEK